MKKLLFAFAAIVALVSCKKETVNPPAPEQQTVFNKKLKTEAEAYSDGTSELITHGFDAQNRATVLKSEYSGDTRVYTFDYTIPGKIFVTTTDNNVASTSYECDVNSMGYITDMKIKYGNGNLYQTIKNTYDANGYIIKQASVFASGQTSLFENTIENGNVTETKYYRNGALNYSATFTYDLTKNSSIGFAFGASWRGSSFGKASKNLITNFKTTNAAGVVTFNNSYTYQLNAAGYVEKCKQLDTVSNEWTETTYTYE